jgi:uncharacterized protein (UPF0179 family)
MGLLIGKELSSREEFVTESSDKECRECKLEEVSRLVV